ncbi:PREDICTED: nesprin-2-like isoform X2 [Cyprinodon variegatus]|uniref:nesprin-2-like isoform X2 n=1 Tax=Cyprinodon variegatus TaxID=28743 RepID=UPI000742A2EE|nr:PREDICTED: nesprin-2-like isoform X2 [Cyprinodon variegatus]
MDESDSVSYNVETSALGSDAKKPEADISVDAATKEQLSTSSDSIDGSKPFHPEAMVDRTSGLEMKETGKETDTAGDSLTQQSSESTTDQENNSRFTATTPTSSIVAPVSPDKVEILDLQATDSQLAENKVELIDFGEQPGITTSGKMEPIQDSFDSNNHGKCEEIETSSQSGEAALSVKEDKEEPGTAVVELEPYMSTKQEIESPEDLDGNKASIASQVITAKTEHDDADNQSVIEQFSEQGKKNEIQILEDQALETNKVATIILDISEASMDESDSLSYKVETSALGSDAKELEADISVSSVMTNLESENGPRESSEQMVTQDPKRDMDAATKEQLSTPSDSIDSSKPLHPETMLEWTSDLQMKVTEELPTNIDMSDNNSVVEQFRELGENSGQKIVEDQALETNKGATIILDISEASIDESDSRSYNVEKCTLGSDAKEFQEDISVSSVMLYQEFEVGPRESPEQTVVQCSGRDVYAAIKEQLSSPSEYIDDSKPLHPEVMVDSTSGLETKETGKEPDTAGASLTQQSGKSTTDQDNYNFFSATESTSPVVPPVPSDKEKTSDLKASDSQIAEDYGEEQPGLTTIPYMESENTPKDSPQQTIPLCPERPPDPASKVQSPTDYTAAPNLTDYIENLWRNTEETKKRYLTLDFPGMAVSQTCELELKQLEKDAEGNSHSNGVNSAERTLAFSLEGKAELKEIIPTEEENVKLNHTISEQNECEQEISQGRTTEHQESGAHQEISEARSAQNESVCILHLDITTSPKVIDNMCVTGDKPTKESAESNGQGGIDKNTSAEAKPFVCEEVLENFTEFIEISLIERDQNHPIEANLENTQSIPDEHPALLTSLVDSESGNLENSQLLSEVRVLQLEIQTGPEDSEATLNQERIETLIDVTETPTQDEEILVIPQETATETSVTENIGDVSQGDSVKLSCSVYESIKPHETRVIEISLTDKDIHSSKTETTIELCTIEQQRPGLPERTTPESFDGNSEEGEMTCMESKEQVTSQTSEEEHENILDVPIIDKTRWKTQPTCSTWKENMPQSDSSQHSSAQFQSSDADMALEEKMVMEKDFLRPQEGITQDLSKTIQERPGDLPPSPKGTELLISNPDTQMPKDTSSVIITDMPNTNPNDTSIQSTKEIEIEDLHSYDIDHEELTVVETDAAQQGQQRSAETVRSENNRKEERQDDAHPESLKGASPGEVQDHRITEQPSTSFIQETETFSGTLAENREILFSKFEVQTVEIQKYPEMEPTIKSVKDCENKVLKEAARETSASLESEHSLVLKVKEDEKSTDEGEEIIQQVEREPEERHVNLEVPLQTTDDEVEPLDEKSKEEETQTSEKPYLKEPERTIVDNIFSEMQRLSRTEIIPQLSKDELQKNVPEELNTSARDLGLQLSRLASNVLHIKNSPTDLSLEAMQQQVEELQKGLELSKLQSSLLPQLGEADAIRGNVLEDLEDQWATVAEEAAAAIQIKEAQLQLVADYCRQRATAKMMLNGLNAEIVTIKMSPEDSSQKQAERICCFQRRMEENRVMLGELLIKQAEICLHLSPTHQESVQIEKNNLLETWKSLERTVESSLYHANVYSQHINTLLADLNGLLERVDPICKDLQVKSSSFSLWSCKEAQHLMEANAEIKAAKQQYLHLQRMSEELVHNSQWGQDSEEVTNKLQEVQNKLCLTEELLSSQTKNSSSPVMEKMVAVMTHGLAWAKQTERDIEGRRRWVPLLPEEVHRQLNDLKKLQSEVTAKQGQLELLVEEVTELLPQLDQAQEVPFVQTSLTGLEELSKSTTAKLSKAIKEVESGLQIREKLSEQMAELDSWVGSYLQSEVSRSTKREAIGHSDMDQEVLQVQEGLAEAERQAAICEALLMTSKDIAVELSAMENFQLFDKIWRLQEDVRTIISHEKNQKEQLDHLLMAAELRRNSLDSIDKSLRQMLAEMSGLKFPITKESLKLLKPLKLKLSEHKSQVDLLIPWTPPEKLKETNDAFSQVQSKIASLEMKSKDHENYLNMKQRLETVKEDIQQQVLLTSDDSRELMDRYRRCLSLFLQFPQIKGLCEEARSNLDLISADLYSSQLVAEQQTIRQTEEVLNALEITLSNNLGLIELDALKGLDLESVRNSTQDFLWRILKELQGAPTLEPSQVTVEREYWRLLSLKKATELQMRALQVLEQKDGGDQRKQELMDLKNSVLKEWNSKMEEVVKTRESWRSYTLTVNRAAQFLHDIEVSLLPLHGSTGPCYESQEETQEALTSLQNQFQSHIEKLQEQEVVQTCLSPQKLEQLQETILSQLLVRMSTLLAKGHIRLENLSRCAEHYRSYRRSEDETMELVSQVTERLLQQMSQKVTCLSDCTDQVETLTALCDEMESILRRLENMTEWCSETSCRGGREAKMAAVWRWMSRLHSGMQKLTARSKGRVTEWMDVTNNVEKASAVLEKVEAELPCASEMEASTEELQELLQSWEQFQERLDYEHRALSALELRAARLLGVPAHLEQAPPIPLCQHLQLMQRRYSRAGQKSKEGLLGTRRELEEREKLREDLQLLRVWLDTAETRLSEMEEGSGSQQLQELYREMSAHKAILQHITDSIRTKYALVPTEIDGQLQEITKSLHQVDTKVAEAVERSGPVQRLGTKLSDVLAGLTSVQDRMKDRSPTVVEAKVKQKRVWDELDVWHSRLAALEVEMQDLETPQEMLVLTEKLVEVQQLHSQVAKQAEQRTTLLSKIQTWLREHQEMIKSSKTWIIEAQSWLAAPCTYTTAKCLSSHVHALQIVLGDSSQIRSTLQGFSSVLKEMSQVCDVTALQDQLLEADHRVAEVQDSFTAPLSQLEHAAAEVEAIEDEVRRMDGDVAEIKVLLSSPETFPSPREDNLKMIEQRIQSMRRTVAEIQKCKPGLCLPEKAEETLTVFSVVEQLQTLLLDLEKKVPALFLQQPPSQAKETQELHPPTSEKEEQGQITVVHFEEDILSRSGGTLQTVKQASPEERRSRSPDSIPHHHGELPAEEAGREEQSAADDGGGVFWWLWESFLGFSPEVAASEGRGARTEPDADITAELGKDVEISTGSTEASSSAALSKPLGTVRTQSVSESVVDTSSTVNISRTDSRAQQRCVVS